MFREIRLLKKKWYRFYYGWRVRRRAIRCGRDLKVSGKSCVNSNTYLGNNVSFNGMSILGRGKVVIGDNFHSAPECLMLTDFHNYDEGETIPYDKTVISKDIMIEDNVWLGQRVIILGGVTVGEGAIIQAGSCVVSDIPKCALAGGHPARVFRYRDIEHYEKLKRERKFH